MAQYDVPPPPATLPNPPWFQLLYARVKVANITEGLTVVVPLAKLTPTGQNGSLTFTNGVLTVQTPAT